MIGIPCIRCSRMIVFAPSDEYKTNTLYCEYCISDDLIENRDTKIKNILQKQNLLISLFHKINKHMKSFKSIFAILMASLFLTSCSENYSNGERVGLITQFSKSGMIWKSYEGHLNMTQTGMNSSTPFDFSIDNDREDQTIISKLDSAANLGWKVKITYHETFGKNWFNNRGETSHFVTGVEILDKNPVGHAFGGTNQSVGKVVDTIYVVIVPKEKVIK